MVERVKSGQYVVDTESSEDEKKSISSTVEYGVVKGGVANDEEIGVFGTQFGFKDTKWYAYRVQRTSVMPELRFSPTAPNSAFEQTFMEVAFAQEEFDSKKDAVDFVESSWV